ncbi:hypothetical protein PoMZ_02455 [Pyricularia oryzae]|uniref:Lysine-specific metallo-endopeptidase domain-containing protein n=1 Tax=Pyricularia oryzae TaxID=318829 RepID=A0A4P7N4U0_PYROR|nr:hypothetical protein PoMZ_02455 [Pyricularia oryzae]
MRKCEIWANNAWFAVRDNDELRRRYFRTDSHKHIKSVQHSYHLIEEACDITNDNIPFRCESSTSLCTSRRGKSLSAFVYDDKDKVYLCPGFFRGELYFNALTLIHELSHLKSIRGTEDYGEGYGIEKVRSLGKEERLMDADTFGYFAREAGTGVRLLY